MVEEETLKAKFALVEEVERDMDGNRTYLLETFAKFDQDGVDPFEEVDYLDNVKNLIEPISEMDWFKKNEVPEDVFDRQMNIIEDNIKGIEKRIAEEEAKGDAKNKELIETSKELRDYLELKIDALNLFFERPVKAEYFKNKIKRLVKKNAKLAWLRTQKWIKAKLPEFLAGKVVSVGGIVFSVYELAESMGGGIIERGQKAIKELGRKLKEIAAEQGGVLGTILHGIGSLLETGAEGLHVLRDHFIAVSVIIILIIMGSYWVFSGPKHRVRVRGSPSKKKTS